MKQYEKKIHRRLLFNIVYNVILIVLIFLGLFSPSAGSNDMVKAFMSGLNAGLFAVAQVYILLGIIRDSKALRSEEKRKALYIEEHDERSRWIQSKIGGIGFPIMLGGLVIATIAAGFLQETVFFTLLGVLIFGALVKSVLLAYYSKNS